MQEFQFSSIFTHLAPVAFPVWVSCLALHRLIRSRSRNRALYAAVFALSCVLGIWQFSDLFAAQNSGAGFDALSLTLPFVWVFVLWVTRRPSAPMYSHAYWMADNWHKRRRRTTSAEATTSTTAHPGAQIRHPRDPVFRTCNRITAPQWGIALHPEALRCVEKKT